MRQVSFSTVRESVRVLYDLPTFSASTKPTEDAVDQLINESCSRLSGILIESFGDDYFTKTATVPAAADGETSPLPDDFYKLRSLTWLMSTDNPVEIQRATLEDYVRDAQLTAKSWNSEAPKYRFEGTSAIRWLPKPSASHSVLCTYVYVLDLSADGDGIDVGPGWETWIANDVCVKIAQIREEDPSVFMAERADAEKRIRSQAPKRDPYAVVQARDMRHMSRRSDGLGGWYSNGRYLGRWG